MATDSRSHPPWLAASFTFTLYPSPPPPPLASPPPVIWTSQLERVVSSRSPFPELPNRPLTLGNSRGLPFALVCDGRFNAGPHVVAVIGEGGGGRGMYPDALSVSLSSGLASTWALRLDAGRGWNCATLCMNPMDTHTDTHTQRQTCTQTRGVLYLRLTFVVLFVDPHPFATSSTSWIAHALSWFPPPPCFKLLYNWVFFSFGGGLIDQLWDVPMHYIFLGKTKLAFELVFWIETTKA